jgi:hypothetical protein
MTTNDFMNRDFLEGIKEDQGPDTESRGWGALLQDYGVKIAEPVVTAARTLTGLARAGENEYLGGKDEGVAADVDRWLGRQQKSLHDEGLSQRQQAIDTGKWFNRAPGERSAWEVFIATITSQAAGLIAPGIAAAATGGGGAIRTTIAGGAGCARQRRGDQQRPRLHRSGGHQ